MKSRIRKAFGHVRETVQRLTRGSREFLTGELDKLRRFSKLLAREIVALFVMAIVAAIALSSLLKSFVFDLFMPLIGLVSPRGDWRNLRLRIGETHFNIGSFLANLLFFLLVALIVFLVLRLMPSRPDIALPHLVRKCPSCGEPLPLDAAECEKCGATFLDLSEGE
jgi:large conductance mechanosensitive channel